MSGNYIRGIVGDLLLFLELHTFIVYFRDKVVVVVKPEYRRHSVSGERRQVEYADSVFVERVCAFRGGVLFGFQPLAAPYQHRVGLFVATDTLLFIDF